MTNEEIGRKVCSTPQLSEIVFNFDDLMAEGRLIVLPVKFGTTLYGVRQFFPSPEKHSKYYSSIYSFVFSQNHLDKRSRIGKEYFLNRIEAERRQRHLDEQYKKDIQKKQKESILVGDCVMDIESGLGQVKELDKSANRIVIHFIKGDVDKNYLFNDFVSGTLFVISKEQLIHEEEI